MGAPGNGSGRPGRATCLNYNFIFNYCKILFYALKTMKLSYIFELYLSKYMYLDEKTIWWAILGVTSVDALTGSSIELPRPGVLLASNMIYPYIHSLM